MVKADYIFIGILILAALIGYVSGFGRTFKRVSKGVVGIIATIFICIMFGGVFRNISYISEIIGRLNDYFEGVWSWLKYLYLGEIIYYVALFVVIRIIWGILIRVILRISESRNRGVKTINKILGALFNVAFIFGICLIALALLSKFNDTELAVDFLAKIEGGYLFKLYENNPLII